MMVKSRSRVIVYLRPSQFVVYDRTSEGSASDDQSLQGGRIKRLDSISYPNDSHPFKDRLAPGGPAVSMLARPRPTIAWPAARHGAHASALAPGTGPVSPGALKKACARFPYDKGLIGCVRGAQGAEGVVNLLHADAVIGQQGAGFSSVSSLTLRLPP